jgi:hypothetical protein
VASLDPGSCWCFLLCMLVGQGSSSICCCNVVHDSRRAISSAWSHPFVMPQVAHPKSFRSSFGYNTNVWASKNEQLLRVGVAAAGRNACCALAYMCGPRTQRLWAWLRAIPVPLGLGLPMGAKTRC